MTLAGHLAHLASFFVLGLVAGQLWPPTRVVHPIRYLKRKRRRQ